MNCKFCNDKSFNRVLHNYFRENVNEYFYFSNNKRLDMKTFLRMFESQILIRPQLISVLKIFLIWLRLFNESISFFYSTYFSFLISILIIINTIYFSTKKWKTNLLKCSHPQPGYNDRHHYTKLFNWNPLIKAFKKLAQSE